jgi:hypothetical protein
MLAGQQLEDLLKVQAIAKQFGAEFVIIGAAALLCFIDDLGTFTADVDIVITLDMEDFAAFSKARI